MNVGTRRRWFIGFLMLCFPFFFFSGGDYYDPRSGKEMWNLGHFLFFALFALVLDDFWSTMNRPIPCRVFGTFCIVLVVGVGIELIQLNIASRSCSLNDVLRDLSGSAIVLLGRASYRSFSLRVLLSGALLALVAFINFVPLGAARRRVSKLPGIPFARRI